MYSCSISTRNFVGGLIALFYVSVAGSDAELINVSPPKIGSTIVNDKSSILVPVPQEPVKPRSPDCFYYFPGTPGWNNCFRKFTQDMATYQEKMHEYVKTQAQIEGATGETSYTRVAPGQYVSGASFANSNSLSTSNSYTGGYAIHAVNMAMSTSLINNVVKISLHTGAIDKFETKTNGNEITIIVLSKGQRKWAKIIVPKGIKLNEVKIDRSSDTVYISGPTLVSDGGNFQMSQSDSSGTGFSSSSSVSQNFGQLPAGSIPSVPVGDFQNAFQNMFQNFFTNMFGGRSLPMTHGRDTNYNPYGNYYSTPQMWFY